MTEVFLRFTSVPCLGISAHRPCVHVQRLSGSLVDTQFLDWCALQRQIGCCGVDRLGAVMHREITRRHSVGALKRAVALPHEIHASLVRNCRLFKFRWITRLRLPAGRYFRSGKLSKDNPRLSSIISENSQDVPNLILRAIFVKGSNLLSYGMKVLIAIYWIWIKKKSGEQKLELELLYWKKYVIRNSCERKRSLTMLLKFLCSKI